MVYIFESVHASDQVVDLVLAVAEVTALDEVVGDAAVSTGWCAQFEGPQEVVGALEVRANGEDLVDQVLDGLETALLAEAVFNNGVVAKGNTLAVNLKTKIIRKILKFVSKKIRNNKEN